MASSLLRDLWEHILALFRQWKALIVGVAFTIGFGVIPAVTGATVPPWIWALAVALAILPASFLAWRSERRRVEELEAQLDLDIEASDIQYGPLGEGPIRAWQVILARFRVTNRSPKHRVSLRFYLQVALLNYPAPLRATGADEEDLRRMLPGERLPDTIASPLALGPEATRTGPLCRATASSGSGLPMTGYFSIPIHSRARRAGSEGRRPIFVR